MIRDEKLMMTLMKMMMMLMKMMMMLMQMMVTIHIEIREERKLDLFSFYDRVQTTSRFSSHRYFCKL